MNEETALTPYHAPALPAEQPIIETQVIVTQAEQPRPRHRKRPPLEVIVSEWIAEKASAETRERYQTVLLDFVAYLPLYAAEKHIAAPSLWPDLENLDSEEWPRLLDAARSFLPLRKDEERAALGLPLFYIPEKPVAIATRNQRSAILRSFYAYCQAARYFPENPLIRLKATKGDDKPNAAYPLEAEAVKRGMQGIDTRLLSGKRDKTMLALLLQTTRRASEVRLLTWQDVLWQDGKITLVFHGKGEKILRDTLDPATQALFEEYRAAFLRELERRGIEFKPEKTVFTGLGNRSFGQVLSHQALSTLCLNYLGDSRVHTTRHTTAVRLRKMGVPMNEIKNQLGHSSEVTTARYLEEKSAEVKPWLADLAKAFGIAD